MIIKKIKDNHLQKGIKVNQVFMKTRGANLGRRAELGRAKFDSIFLDKKYSSSTRSG